ncbi:stage II sporulation protein D [Desulfurispora thermophila]|uniref:stage II sporulation protein D n=1 Tax=Desulfurispora thermophila TaxID=265470 RepID=UPI0003632CA8|nr:stage II sporulation protein D [Desulfurispora thermophila]
MKKFRQPRPARYFLLLLGGLLLMYTVLPLLVFHYQVKVKPRGTVVRLYRHASDRVVKLDLEEYVQGVLAAEMPAEYPLEALKAQAVAARTYVLRRLGGGLYNPPHPGADICDDPAHGQAYKDTGQQQKDWGAKYPYYYYKTMRAVRETAGQVVTWQGQLIDPLYHASCGGRGTAAAWDVFILDVPYLQAVPCPHSAARAEKDRTTVQMSLAELEQRLEVSSAVLPALARPGGREASGSGEAAAGTPLLAAATTTPGGRVTAYRLGDRQYRSAEVRRRLGLRSDQFELNIVGDRVTIQVYGYGHGVGLCQVGAGEMAAAGKSYWEILTHYYPGAKVGRMYNQ